MRIMKLAKSFRTGILPDPETIDYGYAINPLLTLFHILPGLLFIVLGALQFAEKIRNKYIRFHRVSGRMYLVLGFIIGTSSLAMAFAMQYGGWIETAAILVFAPYFLFSLMKAYKYIRKKEFLLHREWMIRAYSIGLAVATMRPLIGLTQAFTDIPFNKSFGPIFWIAFLFHASIAEAWIRFTRK